MTLTPQWLDELRARTTLSTLIGRSIKVTRAGREYKACCPFHHEKTPSFTINDEKGFYHCFGCGAHGDAIRWMTDQRGLSFMDAVKELAATAGMDVPAPDPRAAKQQEEAKSLRDVTAAAADWFTAQLDGIDGAGARAYLQKRGISDATRRAFGFGFAPDSRTKLKTALRDFPVPMLVEAGMLIAVEDKEPYDRFRGRLMIPIRDARGRVIAFGGRILGSGEPKYLNSPDTPLFDKGRTLFNLDRASPASRQTNRVIVVEGYMDVIALAEAGIADAVAPLGTALTDQQLGLLWRMVPVPLLCFDGDAAGQKAAMRAAVRALPLLRPGHSLAFVTLPAGQDPDDIVRSGGAGALEALLAEAQPLVERLWAHELAAAPMATPEERAALKSRLLAHADSIGDADVRHHYREAFRERLDALFARPRSGGGERGAARPAQRGKYQSDPRLAPPQRETRAIAAGGIDGSLVAALLGGLLRYPEALARNADALAQLAIDDRTDAALLDAMIDAAISHQGLDSQGLLAILADGILYNRAKALVRANAMRFSFHRRETDESGAVRAKALRDLDEFVAVLVTQPEIRAQLKAATQRFATSLGEAEMAEQARLRGLDAELTRRLADLSDSGDGQIG
jgi:DNA primase